MDELKVVANEILPVYETEFGDQIVFARELHSGLMVGRDFTTWIKNRIDQYGFTEDDDYFLTLTKSGERQNVVKHEYYLTLDCAKEIAMVENNEIGRAIRMYFIKIEKEFKKKQLPQPKSQAELIAMLAQYNVDQDKRLKAVEERVELTEKRQEHITEVLSLNPTEWRKKVTSLLNKIAKKLGGFEAYRDIRNQSYEQLEERAKCDLNIRLKNRRSNMALEGVPKSKINKLNKMDVIETDARLTEIYLAIIKEMAIRHKIDTKDIGA